MRADDNRSPSMRIIVSNPKSRSRATLGKEITRITRGNIQDEVKKSVDTCVNFKVLHIHNTCKLRYTLNVEKRCNVEKKIFHA